MGAQDIATVFTRHYAPYIATVARSAQIRNWKFHVDGARACHVWTRLKDCFTQLSRERWNQ